MWKSDKVITYPNKDSTQQTTLFSFNIKGIDPEDVGYILENSYNIVIRSGLHCAPLIHEYIGTFPNGCVRISPSFYTTDDEVDAFIFAVQQILKMVK